jgi:hypothetical protein
LNICLSQFLVTTLNRKKYKQNKNKLRCP